MRDHFKGTVDDIGRRRALRAACSAGLLSVLPFSAARAADAWPKYPIDYIVPFAAGGLTDVVARMVGKSLGVSEGWNIVVENKPGGNANIGADFVVRARPDGYTWLAITLAHAANVTLTADNAGYNLLTDLRPLAGVASSPMLVVVNSKSSIKSMQDLLKVAKGGKMTAGSSGNGTPPHLTLALYEKLTGTSITHVPYKGGAPSLTDLLGGQIDVIFSNLPESLPLVQGGGLRALAITTKKRFPALPTVPTVIEIGMPGLIVENFTGLMAPAHTPDAIVQKIGNAVVAEMSKTSTQNDMEKLGLVTEPRGPAAFGVYLKSEVDRWRTVIKEAGIHTT